MPIIDSHCHILPGIDDGSQSVEESLEMLHMMKNQGVDFVVATPHFYGKKRTVTQFLEEREASFQTLKEHLDEDCPEILLGAETAFHFGISGMEDLEKLCIEGTNTLLLELPKMTPWSDYEMTEIQNIVLNRGLDVIIAHYEKYRTLQRKNPYYERVLDLPVSIQISADVFGGLFKGKEELNLFREGKAHLLCSDAHNMSDRIPNLGKGRAALAAKLGQSQLDEMDKFSERLFLQRKSL